MLSLLIRFLIWLALCTAVYFLAKSLGLSNWVLVGFAFGSLALYLVAVSRQQK